VIDEVRSVSRTSVERQQNFEIGWNWIYVQVGQDIFFVENGTTNSGLLVNDGRSNFTQVAKA